MGSEGWGAGSEGWPEHPGRAAAPSRPLRSLATLHSSLSGLASLACAFGLVLGVDGPDWSESPPI